MEGQKDNKDSGNIRRQKDKSTKVNRKIKDRRTEETK
jgi:hypothetical protein